MPISRRDALCLLSFGLTLRPISALGGGRNYPQFQRGINFHHMLNWPRGAQQASGFVYDNQPFGDAYYQTSAAELARLKCMGFTFIRLTADPAIAMTAKGDKLQAVEDHISSTMQTLLDAGFDVILDLHPITQNSAVTPELLMDAQGPVFAGYVDLVARMARLMANFPTTRVALELMNEPIFADVREAGLWQAMAERLHSAARTQAKDLALVIGGIQWNSRQGLMLLDTKPFEQSNVFYTFHYYDPHAFTHQGLEGQDTKDISGLSWPMEGNAVQRARQHIATNARVKGAEEVELQAQTDEQLEQLERHPHTAASIRADFAAVTSWASKLNIAAERIILGEFGCVLSAKGEPLGRPRSDWLLAVRTAAEQAGFAWAYWAYVGYGGMELADQNRTPDLSVVEALGLKFCG